MQPGTDPGFKPNTQYIQSEQNPPLVAAQHPQPVILQPQIVYVLKYRPESQNMRHWSYLAFFIGVVIFFGSMILEDFNGSAIISMLGESICCLFFGLGFFLDAAFYKGKSEWESSTGQSNSGSTAGMIFDILFGLIAIGVAISFVFWFIDFSSL
tara:strand:- start:10 stop:471 length:462 start_codon:yes stop_codon:yes gene_type:complete